MIGEKTGQRLDENNLKSESVFRNLEFEKFSTCTHRLSDFKEKRSFFE